MRNERGSIPLILIVVFTLGIAITALTQLFLSESLTAKDMANAEAKRLYEYDKILEIVTNLTFQKLKSKEWQEEYDSELLLSSDDLTDMEQAINDELLPFESSNQTIRLTPAYSDALVYFCEPLYDITLEEEQGDFLTNSCLKKSGETGFTLSIQSKSHAEDFKFVLTDIYPTVTDTGEYIVLDLSQVKLVLK